MNYNNINITNEGQPDPEIFKGYIENYVGVTQVPLLIDSTTGKKEVMVPMATTEGALVISYTEV